MGSWQELSGYAGTTSKGKEKQQEFWDSIRKHPQIGDLNLGDNERLCAIALIKRLFPYVAEKAIGWQPDDVNAWPSTSYFAAVPWLIDIQKMSEANKLRDKYVRAVKDNLKKGYYGEMSTKLDKLDGHPFNGLDGQLYFQHSIESDKERQYINGEASKTILQNHLVDINKAVGHPPSPFYALLLMDGDSLGKLLRKLESNKVSSALACFTNQVDGIVTKHCGKTVYAGGDDVLALLPLDQALDAATQLRDVYLNAFVQHVGELETRPEDEKGQHVKTTISAGLVFAHYKTSLRAVLAEAHHLLDKVAKDGNGRDSLAVSVLTGGGRTVQWCSSWTDTNLSQPIPAILQELEKVFNQQFASKFFYNVRQRIQVLTGDEHERAELGYTMPDNLDAYQLLRAEYRKSLGTDILDEYKNLPDAEAKKKSSHAMDERVGKLVHVCRVREGTDSQADINTLNISGAMLVRFLATKGRGVES